MTLVSYVYYALYCDVLVSADLLVPGQSSPVHAPASFIRARMRKSNICAKRSRVQDMHESKA